ncbi:DUF4190 domain-containing protein [Streptomyces sp. CWNU-52B]|uniref:DUF4190 domain-containing protein n=1 Tax=unclassified Streptomyces TaxID=2593676 RepID=UPI0039BFB4CC
MEIPPPGDPQQPQPPQQPQGQGYAPYPGAPYPYQGQGPGPYGPQGPVPYGYQPWGHGYSPYNSPPPVNGLAITALVFGVQCFLPLVGLIFGIFALVQIKKKGHRGKGLAVTGMVLSGLGTAVLALTLAVSGPGFWDDLKENARDTNESGASFSVDRGECFDTPGGALEGMAESVDTVPCEGEHDAEVFANFQLPGGGYPGDDAVAEAADDRCYALQYAYAMDSWAVPEDVDVYYFTPTRDSWGLGDREVSCLFGNVDERGTLTGSLRQDSTNLDADQLAYLKAARVLNEAMDSVPDAERIEDDLPGHKAWASRVADATTEQAGLLRGHEWPADARKPVGTIVEDLQSATEEWAAAAKSSDADTFYVHYDKAYGLTDGSKTVAAREALGLATVPPVYDGEDGGDGDDDGGGTGEGGGGSGSGGSGAAV